MPKKSTPKPLTEEQQILLINRMNPVLWLYNNKVSLGHGPWVLKNHWYQEDIINCKAQKQCDIKGAQMGAAISVNELVPTPDGFKRMGDIFAGDLVFGKDGEPYNVTAAYQVWYDRECFKVAFSDGTEIITDVNHRWNVRNVKYNSYHTLTTGQIYPKVRYRGGKRARYAIDVAAPLSLPDRDLPVDPYVLGLWLGDGAVSQGRIIAEDKDAVVYMDLMSQRGYTCDHYVPPNKDLSHIYAIRVYHGKRTLISIIRELGLHKGKRIPIDYLRSSYGQRLDLLRGLMDTDGHIQKDGFCFFNNTNKDLIDGVCELIKTLGWKSKIYYKGLNTHGFGGKERQSPPTKKWEIYFRPDDTVRVANLKRKYDRQTPIRRPKETNSRYIIDIVPVPSVPVRCISVNSPDHLYCVTKSFIPTHNSEAHVLRTLHGMIHGKYPKGALYLFPTRDDVGDFSKSRFDPLIAENPCIGSYVKDTDSKHIKKIGKGFLMLRGARVTKKVGGTKKSSSQLKSFPVDRIVFDELDEMDEAMIELALERISHSEIQEEIYLGTPTIPDFGIDKLYQNSTQRIWIIKCKKCNGETCLELEFPECLHERTDGRVYRACKKCGAAIHPRYGQWVDRYPDREMVGRWIGQLNSMYVEPAKILRLYRDPPNGNLSEVYNSKLGMAYIAAENRLTMNDIWNVLGQDPMAVEHEGPTAMGVDIGKDINVVIGVRPNNKRLKIIKTARVSTFEDLHDLGKKFNVKCAVMDMYPETRKCREFQKEEKYQVFLCAYSEHQRGDWQWNEKDGEVVANRTEICDATHELVTKEGLLELPRKSEELEEYAKQMISMAKILDEDEDTGSKIYRYKKLGADHYRHATNYLLLAKDRIGMVTDKNVIGRYFRGRRGRTAMTA